MALSPEQRRWIEEYAREWDPIAVLRCVWPSIWTKALTSGMDRDEIASAAWDGIVRAAEKFDTSNGTIFASYASHWIRGAVSREARDRLCAATPRGHNLIRADAVLPGRDHARWGSLRLADPDRPQDDPEEFDRLDRLRSELRFLLSLLRPNQRDVLVLRYGLDGGGYRTFVQIGTILKMSRQRIQQIEVRAIKRIELAIHTRCKSLVRLGRGQVSLCDMLEAHIQE